jgi:DDE superfamily endonuclease
VRNAVARLLVAFEPWAGWRHVAVSDHRRRSDWAHCVADLLAGPDREAARWVLGMDQLNTPSPARLSEALAPDKAQRWADRLEIPDTPQQGSWLNRGESEWSLLAPDWPARVGTRALLAQRVAAWEQRRNRSGRKADGPFTTTEARLKLRKLYPTVEN